MPLQIHAFKSVTLDPWKVSLQDYVQPIPIPAHSWRGVAPEDMPHRLAEWNSTAESVLKALQQKSRT